MYIFAEPLKLGPISHSAVMETGFPKLTSEAQLLLGELRVAALDKLH